MYAYRSAFTKTASLASLLFISVSLSHGLSHAQSFKNANKNSRQSGPSWFFRASTATHRNYFQLYRLSCSSTIKHTPTYQKQSTASIKTLVKITLGFTIHSLSNRLCPVSADILHPHCPSSHSRRAYRPNGSYIWNTRDD